MQIYQQITNNLEQRLHDRAVLNSLFSKFTMSKFSSVLAICLITFSTFLFTKTLEIQHSCNPMIYSGELPTECQVASNDSTSSDRPKSPLAEQTDKSRIDNSSSKEPPQIAQTTSKPQPTQIPRDSQASTSEIFLNSLTAEPQTQTNPVTKAVNAIKEHPDDVVGAVAGAAGAAATVAAAGATAVFSVPAAGAVLIGLSIWAAIRSIF